MELNVRLNAKDVHTEGVFDALERLCLCFKPEEFRHATIAPPKEDESTVNIPVQQIPPVPAASVPTTAAPSAGAAPVQQIPTAPITGTVPTAIPTASPQSFTIPQIAQAAAVYAETSDAARQNVIELINSFGAHALNEIPQDKLGEFATGLRGLGARI